MSPPVAGGGTRRPVGGNRRDDPAIGCEINDRCLNRRGCRRPRAVVGRANEQTRLADGVGVAVAVGGDRLKRAIGDRLPAVGQPKQAIGRRRQRLADAGHRPDIGETGVGQPVVIDAVDAVGRREQAGIDRTNFLGRPKPLPGRRLGARFGVLTAVDNPVAVGDDQPRGCESDSRYRADGAATDSVERRISHVGTPVGGVDISREHPLIGADDKPVGRRRNCGCRPPMGKAERPDLVGRHGDSGDPAVGADEDIGDAGFRAENPLFGQRLHTCLSIAGGQKASRLRRRDRADGDAPATRSEQRYAGPHATGGHALL